MKTLLVSQAYCRSPSHKQNIKPKETLFLCTWHCKRAHLSQTVHVD